MSGIHNVKYYSLSLSFLLHYQPPSPPLKNKTRKLGTSKIYLKNRIEYIAINFWPITNKIQLMFVNTCRATFFCCCFSGEKHINIIEKSKRQGNQRHHSRRKKNNNTKPPSSTFQQQQNTTKHNTTTETYWNRTLKL